MREIAGVALSIAIPWIAGTLAVAALWRGRPERSGAMAVGYGGLLGFLATVLVMRAASIVGWRWSFASIAGALIVLACVAGYAARPVALLRSARPRAVANLAAMSASARAVFWLFAALVAVNVLCLGACVARGLIEPYDALAHWADKARVWYEYGRLIPFVNAAEWRSFADMQHYWDPNPNHPAAAPLLQVWTVLGAGTWDESLMNAPWLAAFVALGFAFYAQVRRLGATPADAMVCTYLLLSLPFLQINVAVAGMADLFVGLAYGLAAMSLWYWTRTRRWQDAALALIAALFCALAKVEGIVWAATLAPAVAVALNRRIGLALCAAGAVAGILFLAFWPGEIAILGYTVMRNAAPVWLPTFEHMFVMDNWHLLWYAAVAVVAWNARLLFRERLAPMTVTIGAAAGFVFIVYAFSNASVGVSGENLVNRFMLHAVPALAFYLVAIVREREPPIERAGVPAAL